MRYLAILSVALLLSGCTVTCGDLAKASKGIDVAQGVLSGAANAGSETATTAEPAAGRAADAARVAIAAARRAKHCELPTP